MNWSNKKFKGKFQIWGRLNTTAKEARQQANTTVLGQGKFIQACERAGIKPTRRQASKWNLGKGLAYSTRNFKGGIE